MGLTSRTDLRSIMSDASFFWYLLIRHNTETSVCIKVINAVSRDCFKLPAAILTGIFTVSFQTENAPGKGHIISYCLLKTRMPILGY